MDISQKTLFIKKGKPLDSRYVECGTVTKVVIADPEEHDGIEVSLLELSAGAKIADHTHAEAEEYTNVRTGETRRYKPYEVHGLKNEHGFTDKWISKKWIPKALSDE